MCRAKMGRSAAWPALCLAVAAGCAGPAPSGSPTPDTVPPTVSLVEPLPDSAVSGGVALGAEAADDTAVAGVQFLVDGREQGSEDTTAPYEATWDSSTVGNGAHVLAARARDTAGNLATSPEAAVTVLNDFSLELGSAIGGFTHPLDLQAPVESSEEPAGRVFVVEQGGRVRIIQGSEVLGTPFLDLSAELSSSAGEEGLLGLAFHPQYAVNRRFYVNYTSGEGGLHTVVAEYQVSAADTSVADPSSRRLLLTIPQPYANHNGGALAFGPDGFLYIALGDGGSGGDPGCRAQDLGTLLGKILRVDVDAVQAPRAYAIPADNPLVGRAGEDEIWIYGVRNPFRFSFDRQTGDIWIGDVGQGSREELDMLTPSQQRQVGGVNLGWNLREGGLAYGPSGCTQAPGSTLTDPVFDYDRSDGDVTVIGGYVYRGDLITGLRGQYVFGDFGSGRIWTLTRYSTGVWVRASALTTAPGDLSAFGQAPDGELYVVRYTSGEVARIRQVDAP